MGLDSAKKGWKKDETTALIALYESERDLYDKKAKTYYDFEKRNEGYERIHQIMLRIRPNCTVAEIKSRIKYLRTQYASELFRRNVSIESGLCSEDTYKPSMWCFGLLQFLDEFISTKKDASKIEVSEEEKNEHDAVDYKQVENGTAHHKRNYLNYNDSSNLSDITDKSDDLEYIEEKRSRKKRKIDTPSSSGSTLDAPSNMSVQNTCDREDIFGQYIASEMRALRDNPLLYLQTKQSILEILTSANFEFINPE